MWLALVLINRLVGKYRAKHSWLRLQPITKTRDSRIGQRKCPVRDVQQQEDVAPGILGVSIRFLQNARKGGLS